MNKMNQKKNTNRINTYELGNQLHKHLAERARLQREHDDLWTVIHRYKCNRSAEMNEIDSKIGKETYAIDGLINKLIRAGGHSTKAHQMAIDYLKSQIARNQRIAAKRENYAKKVDRGEAEYICSDGTTSTETRDQWQYVGKKKQKVANYQKMLSQLTKSA